jgi:hypothetical protein
MKYLSLISLLLLGLFLAAGLVACSGEATPDTGKTDASDEVCPVTGKAGECPAGEDEDMSVEGKTPCACDSETCDAEKKAADVEKKAGDAMAGCPGCTALKAGATGWCAECGTGFYEGKEVNCKDECGMNPGGPPCENCVK